MSSTLVSGFGIPQDDLGIRRNNLLLLCRMVVRALLESCMQTKNRMLSADHQQLQDMLIMVEKALKHGLRMPRSVLSLRSADDQLWNVIERLGKRSNDAAEAVSCIQQLPSIHSNICRVRAWLRLALMQKKLSDYFVALVEAKELMNETYEPWAVLRHDSTAIVFSGTLIGLRVIDCNLYLKEDDLLKQPTDIELSMYIKIPTVSLDEDECSQDKLRNEQGEDDLQVVVDQKHYLEERNKYLLTRLTNLQHQLEIMQGMKDRNSLTDSQQHEAEALDSLSMKESRQDLAHLQEMETAMTLMEKDIHEKQDTIVLLRKQIDDIKKINIDLYQKLRSLEESTRQKDKTIGKAEQERGEMQKVLQKFDERIKDDEMQRSRTDEFLKTLQLELREKTEFCASVQRDFEDLKAQNAECEEMLASERFAKDELQVKLRTLANTERHYQVLQQHFETLQKKVEEYEATLEEMGVQMERSKLRMEDLKESAVSMSEAQWESDKEASSCKQCEKPFSVSRRKHHCRNCGGIFCNSCSENTMPLPSSAKPVRVCDNCYALLLKRFSAKAGVAD